MRYLAIAIMCLLAAPAFAQTPEWQLLIPQHQFWRLGLTQWGIGYSPVTHRYELQRGNELIDESLDLEAMKTEGLAKWAENP